MELDWSTFGLQILNFLVLVWLLKRFLYKPVFTIIAERRAAMEQLRTEAERFRAEGEALKQRYEGRLAEWEQEKQKARASLLEELRAERTRLMEEVRRVVAQEREKAKVLEERRQQELQRQAEEAALALGARFAARLLERLAQPSLTGQLAVLAVEELRGLPEERRRAIRAVCQNGDTIASVVFAHPVDDSRREALAAALSEVAGRTVPCSWTEDASLLAGVQVSLGPWVFCANLREELKGFTESAHAADGTL
ncbi:MAG: F0F1 ATP synthase subunit delta [Nitrospira sp.]|nr:F0F1 ATP synthase subunit delta [Nitrospira sp.]MCP9443245.1 F0F1 ATP synthase subunit delta [Nitrospira sp.]